jgi:hypothetical protein
MAISTGVSDRTGLPTWTSEEKEVREPREGVKLMLVTVKETCLDCERAFGGDKRAAPASVLVGAQSATHRKSWAGPQIPMPGATSTLALDVDRMFTEAISIFGEVEFNRESVVVGVLKVALKQLIEEARFTCFSTRGYQQLM